MVRARFVIVKRTKKVSFYCLQCAKRMHRQKTDWQSVNPWNKTSEGLTKTTVEILKEIDAGLSKWAEEKRKTRELCSTCKRTQGAR